MAGSALTEKVGDEIRRLRREKKLSQEDFADLCGLHRTYIGSIERGEKSITIETAKKVMDALGLKLSELFSRVNE